MDPAPNAPLSSAPPPPPRADDAPEPPPPGVKAAAVVRWILIALAALAAAGAWLAYAGGARAPRATTATGAAAAKYTCPMHPQIVSDEPGECPICHMQLVPIAPERAAAPDAAVGEVPGAVPPGTTPITLALDRVQSIGVRTALVEARDTGGALRVTATVAAPEQGAAEVHVRAPGFVERLGVRETGVKVAAGQELLGLYSPEVFQAESELLAAKSFGEQGGRTVAAARERLELLGMSPRAIDEVLASGKAMRVIPVVSPASGYVSKKSVVLGSYVAPETALYEIVDLSKVFVLADVFQTDIAQIHVGTEGTFTPAQRPDDARTAKVDLVYPQLDPAARTTRVRMQVKNDHLDLRPGQYGNVEFAVGAAKMLVVPRDAVVDTGRVTYVFLDEGNGRFVPRVVRLGKDVEEHVEVREGLAAGERVVSGATFLVDSESRLEASLAATSGAGDAGAPAAPSACDAAFDRAKYPEKWAQCQRCETQHAGMGSMAEDCKNAIPKPWR